MSEKEFNEIFSKNLRCRLERSEMTQKELAKLLGVGPTSVYNWLNAIKTPRMDKVDAMCNIFHCKRADLLTADSSASASDPLRDYYNQLIQFLDGFPEYRQLVSDAVHVRPEDIDFASQCLERLADPESSAPDLPDSARSGLTAEALALVRDTPEVLAAEAEYIKSRSKQQSKPERSASTSTGGVNRKSG